MKENINLIYDKNNIKVYHITSFDEAKDKGKSTKWCTSENKKAFDVWTSNYNMYIIVDKNKDLNSDLRKVCYLNDGENDTFVTSENVHYFKENPEYDELKSYYGEEIMKLMI